MLFKDLLFRVQFRTFYVTKWVGVLQKMSLNSIKFLKEDHSFAKRSVRTSETTALAPDTSSFMNRHSRRETEVGRHLLDRRKWKRIINTLNRELEKTKGLHFILDNGTRVNLEQRIV